MKCSILGVGTFGKAMASHLLKNNHEVLLDTAKDSDVIFLIVPSHACASALLKEKENINNQPIIVCSKGFSEEGELLYTAIKKVFKNNLYFLYGPTLADELLDGKLSGMILAGGEGKELLKKELESDYLRIELSEDVVGAQIGASLKNVFTIFVGISEGLNMGENAKAYFFTKGLEEMQRIGVSLGAKQSTFVGLNCAGDLLLHSRNRKLGILLGEGKTLEEAIKEMEYTPQGIDNLKDIKKILQNQKLNPIEAPMVEVLHKVLFENYPVKQAVKEI
ncbi:MAG: hypothetical protein K9L98_00375 [Candidatus Pacebacteria bacterium]|nr:hypothetical protein [Candidatus Paceibacterota bacterium]MCF7862454.1 hypothetical protein [Candidatus Paceibacterota bacterium]